MTMWFHLGRGHMLSLHFVQRRSLLGSPRRSLLQVQRSSQKRRQDIHLPARTCQPRRVHSRHLRRQHNLLCKRKRFGPCCREVRTSTLCPGIQSIPLSLPCLGTCPTSIRYRRWRQIHLRSDRPGTSRTLAKFASRGAMSSCFPYQVRCIARAVKPLPQHQSTGSCNRGYPQPKI